MYRYFQDSGRVAALLNVHVFGGRSVVKESDVQEKDSRATGIFDRLFKKSSIQKYRDLIRRVALNTNFVIVALEHQDKIHHAMPIRIMFGDAANYDEQMRKI